MKKYSIIFLFLLTVITLSCTKENCSENVIPPQASVFIEVLDEDTDENVFTNETYTVGDISVTEFDDTEVDFVLITRDSLNLIQIFPKTNVELDNKIYLNIADDETIEIQYDVETLNTECYTQKRIINVNIPFYTFTEENQIFRIKI
ncbi:hypothetical protein [Flavobacterium sp. N2270]|uniref:hypothetical protein n=1 Tax=Flavobacterium sp. N2270 TaxID=2986831 RepID=UPI0022241EE6|nr:hypothetical protein [Flavobacterium sp. N2270]